MGLDLFLFKVTEQEDQSEPKIEQIGQFQKYYILFDWINENVQVIPNMNDEILAKENLQALLDYLNTFNQEESGEYLWYEVQQIKEWVVEILDSFNFETNKLCLIASW